MSAGLANSVVAMDWNGQTVEAVEGEWLLGLSPKSDLMRGKQAAAQVASLERQLGRRRAEATVEEQLGADGQFLLGVPASLTYDQLLAAVKKLPGFLYLEPNAVLELDATTPNDPAFNYLYGLNNTGSVPFDTGASLADADVDAAEAWDVTTGSASVVVGVIDSGVDYTHPDLAPNMWRNPFETPGDGVDNDRNGYVDDVHGINAITGSGNPMDDEGHGTHVAGTIGAAGNNGIGVAGAAWDVQIMALKFLAADGSGDTADAIEALNYATAMRNKGVNIKLTSNSWGGGGYEQALRDAIARTASAGMLFVAAAGNEGVNNDAAASYPANYDLPNVVSVAATDRFDVLADFSNYGAANVDLAAPGVDIVSTYMGGGYGYMSGTSMAAPLVSGVAALAWSVKDAATYSEVRGALLGGVDRVASLSGKVATGGRLNALGTLRNLGNTLSGAVYNDADNDGARGPAEAGVSGRTVYLDLDDDAVLDSSTATVPSANVPASIPDRAAVASTLSAGGLGGAITDVDVKIDIVHPYDSDLVVFLTSPSGKTVQLVSDAGGSGDNFANTVFDDEASAAVTSGAAPFTGRYRPQGALSDFDGSAPGGTWTLTVHDTGLYDVGTLRNWSLTLTTGDTAVATDAAGNYSFAKVAPGQYVVRQSVPAGWAGTAPAAGYHRVDAAGGEAVAGRDFGSHLLPAADANDQISEATGHAVGYYVTSSVENGTDVDVYGFDVVAGQRVGFDVDATAGSALDSYLRLFNAGGAQLAASNNAAAPGEALGLLSYVEYTFGAAGRYYVAVSGAPNWSYDPVTGAGDAAGSTGGYTLALAKRTVGADADDQLGEARLLAVGGTTAADSIATGTDVDVYAFDAVAGQRIAFDVDAAAGSLLDSYLRLFNAGGSQLATSNNAAAPGEAPGVLSYLEFTFAAAGRYFVAVSGAPNWGYSASTGNGDAAGSAGGYTLAVTSRTAAAATTVAPSQPTVSEVRGRRLSALFSRTPVTRGETPLDGEGSAVLDVLDSVDVPGVVDALL